MSKKNKKRKLSKKKIFLFFIMFFAFLFVYKLINTKITNIYISGNSFLTDQEIIDIAELSEYPKSFFNFSYIIKKRLEKNTYIHKVTVNKNNLLNKVYIKLEENYPLFYDSNNNSTILYDGTKTNQVLSNVTLINEIPNNIYDKFLLKFKNIDINILNRISEIEYKPNEIFVERFLLLMTDGNYIYITLDKFNNINKYLNIVKEFNSEKGILYLDSGEYFDSFD